MKKYKLQKTIFIISFLFLSLFLNEAFGQGSVTTEGDSIIKASELRAKGVLGGSIKIGIISDGIKGIELSQKSGDIPATYEAKSERSDGKLNTGGRGLAMMEIIHDLAPQAQLAFSNADTSKEMISAIRTLANTFKCDIIVDDLNFYDQPFFEDGEIAKQIREVVNQGKLYISSAGDVTSYYEKQFKTISGWYFKETGEKAYVHDFGGAKNPEYKIEGDGYPLLGVTIPANSTLEMYFQWNEPWGQASTYYVADIRGADAGIPSDKNKSFTRPASSEPYSYLKYANNNNFDETHYLLIGRPVPGRDNTMKIICVNGSFEGNLSKSGSIVGYKSSKDVFTVGAANYANPTTLEAFSAQGPVRIDFPYLEYRSKPDICGIDGVSITKNGEVGDRFNGTGAAAAHVAGAAALLWSANKVNLTASTVKNLLKATAVNLGNGGVNNVFGYGRTDVLQAYKAYSTNTVLTSSIESSLSSIRVFPNPIKLSSLDKNVVFDYLQGDETIKIYTILGELVSSFKASGGKSWEWQLTNSFGKEIVEGTYIYLIMNGAGQKRTGKIVVMN